MKRLICYLSAWMMIVVGMSAQEIELLQHRPALAEAQNVSLEEKIKLQLEQANPTTPFKTSLPGLDQFELPYILAGTPAPDDSYPYVFFCTVYYTPRESGFTEAEGFDVTPETREGLEGRHFPRDFLRAVRIEGFGRLAKPQNGKRYIKYDGNWGYADRVLGNRNNTLVPRRSAAVGRPHPVVPRKGVLNSDHVIIEETFGENEWKLGDTGGGLHEWQIDLYWGEDDPYGPGEDVVRPRGTDFQHQLFVPVMVAEE